MEVYGTQQQVTVTHYRLDTGVIFLWKSSSGVWQNGWSPGSSKSWNGSFNIGLGKKNVKVYPYTEDNFHFNNTNQYHWNSNTFTTNKIQYDTNYSNFSTFPLQVAGANTYQESNGKLTVTYNATFMARGGSIFNVKDELRKPGGAGKQYLIDLLGNPSQDIIDKMNLLDPNSESYSSNVEGYLFFIPIIIQYDELTKVEIPEEPEEPEEPETEVEQPPVEEPEQLPEMAGVASLLLPEYTYEGHAALAEDQSGFQVNDVKYSATAAYKAKLATNEFKVIPQGAGTVKKLEGSHTQAHAVFPRRGMYSVSLNIKMKNEEALSAIKPIEVRKTPYIIENLGGIQKVNRKQVLNISVATYPDQPIIDYYVKVKSLKTPDEIILTEAKPQENSALIKTRVLKTYGDKYWTNFELEFITKTDGEYQYTVFAKDAKGDTDIQQKNFTVRPDLPPEPIIGVQDSFIRNKGTDIAEITLEDESLSDGDQLERKWSVYFENPLNGASQSSKKGSEVEDSFSYQDVSKIPGYEELGYGNGQKVKFQKQGVGKVKVKLHVTDVWNEPTLEEYITSADYLSGEITADTEVINISPKITLEMGKSKELDLIILTGKTSLPAISANINNIRAAFIEKSIDANISLLAANLPEEGKYRWIADWEWPTSINCFTCRQNNKGLMDSEFAYRITSPGKVMSGYQEVCITNAPHMAEALCPGDEHCRCKVDPATGQKISMDEPHVVWSYPINGSGKFALFIDNLERNIYIADYDKKKTLLLNRKTGTIVGELDFLMEENPIVSDLSNDIFFIDVNKIQRYIVKDKKLSTVTNQGGQIYQISEGQISFLGKKQGTSSLAGSGNGWYLGSFDMKTGQVYEKGVPVLSGYSDNVTPCDLDIEGNAVFRQDGKLWLVNPKTQQVISLNGVLKGDYMNSTGFVKDEMGRGVMVYNCYSNIDYKGSGRFYFNLYTIKENGLKLLTSRSESITGFNGKGISYAKLHSNEGKIYVLQGANWQNIDAVSSVKGFAFAVDAVTGAISTGFGQWGWDQVEEAAGYNGSLMNTTGSYDQWVGMTSRIKLFRNYYNGNQSKVYQLYTNGYFSQNGTDKVIATDEKTNDSNLKSDTNFQQFLNEKGARHIEQPGLQPETLAQISQKIEELPQNVLELKGEGQGKVNISKEITFIPDTEYVYRYEIKSFLNEVEDVFHPIINYRGLGDVKNMPQGSIPVYKSLALEDSEGHKIEARGTKNDGSSNSKTIEIQMEQEGVMEFREVFTTNSYNNSDYEISLNGNVVDKGSVKLPGFDQNKSLMLSKGNHQIKFTVTVGRDDKASFAINNIKIYYYGDQNPPVSEKNIKVTSGQSIMVENRFYSPKEAAFVKNERTGNFYREEFLGNVPNSSYLSFTLKSQGTVKDPIRWSFQPTTKSASFGSTYFQNGEGNFNIHAPADKILLVSFKEQVVAPINNTPTYSGGTMISPTTVVVKPAQTYSRYYYLSSGGDRGGYGSVNIRDIQIMEIDPTQVDINRLFLNNSLINYALSQVNDNFAIIDLLQDSYKLYLFTNVNGQSTFDQDIGTLSIGTDTTATEAFGCYLWNFKLYRVQQGKEQLIFEDKFNDQSKFENEWRVNLEGNSSGKITLANIYQEEIEEIPLIYKKGQLVKYNLYYEDYEADPSKRQYWRYTHTPYNDGSHPEASMILDKWDNVVKAQEKILDKPIERFYIDGKYTVEHWQEDNTARSNLPLDDSGYPLGNPDYDKLSNVENLTFYIEGGAKAPWITSIQTLVRGTDGIWKKGAVKEGQNFKIEIGIDDEEKDILNLTTEVYRNKKLIYTHFKDNITPKELMGGIKGNYPLTTTDLVTNARGSSQTSALIGPYEVICTVRDETGAGMGSYKFTVVSEGKIMGYVNHTDEWEQNRRKYNVKNFNSEINRKFTLTEYLALNKPRQRGTNVFWSGEKFILQAEVGGNPTKVTCQILNTGKNNYSTVMKSTGKINAEGEILFAGELWDNTMVNKWGRSKPEALTFRFTSTYGEQGNSGEVPTKTHDVVILVDSQQDFWQLHRLW